MGENNHSNEVTEMLKSISQILTEFTNLNFELYLQSVDKDGAVTFGANVRPFTNIKSLNQEVVQHLVNIISNQIKLNLEEKANITKKDLNDLIEDICIEIIFEIDSNSPQEYDKTYDFIRQLEKLSYKTYENDPINTGVIVLKKENNKPKDILLDLEVDFISINEWHGLDDLIKKEKPLLKLVDGKSLAFVVNQDFKVIGFVRKHKNSKSIQDQVNENYVDKHYKRFMTQISRHVADIYRIQSKPETASKVADIIINQFDLNEDQAAEMANAFLKLFEKYRGNVPNELANIDFDEPGDKLKSFYYIKVSNGGIQCIYNYNFIVTLKKRKWKIQHHAFLGAFLFNNICIRDILSYCGSDKREILKTIDGMVAKIIELIKVVKMMSENNIGGLFVVLDYPQEDGAEGEFNNYRLPKGLIKNDLEKVIHKEILSYLGDDYGVNILDIDKYLIALAAGVDGATILDNDLNLISFGEIIDNSNIDSKDSYGARTNAAISASNYGLSIKVSEDGDIEIYKDGLLKHSI
ncbi:MAG: hypothetical protein FH756_10225 [Firmicutes bacterium]|nr:hypothetical protein [Bacillota bacterium]